MKREIKWKYLWIALICFLLLLGIKVLDLMAIGLAIGLPLMIVMAGSFLLFIENVLGSFFVQSNESARRHKIMGRIFSALCFVLYLTMALFFDYGTWYWPVPPLQKYMILAFAISAILAIVNFSLSKPTNTNSANT